MKEDKIKQIFTDPRAVLLTAVACSLLWGSAYPCIKIGYRLFQIEEGGAASKILFAGIRFTLAGLMTLGAGQAAGGRLWGLRKNSLVSVGLLGLVQTTLQYVFFYIGLSNTTGVKGSVLNATGTFLAVLLAHFFCKGERMNGQKAIGCAVGFAGIIIINLGGGMDAAFRLTGEGFMILAAFSFAVGSLISKKAAQGNDSVMVTGYQLAAGGVLLLGAGLVGGGELPVIQWSGVLLLLYLAFLSAAAFSLWTILLKYNQVAKVTVYNFLVPVFGVLLSALFLGENILRWQNAAALLLVCAGIYFVNRPRPEGTA